MCFWENLAPFVVCVCVSVYSVLGDGGSGGVHGMAGFRQKYVVCMEWPSWKQHWPDLQQLRGYYSQLALDPKPLYVLQSFLIRGY